MRYKLGFLTVFAVVLLCGALGAQEDNTVSTAQIFSSMISGDAGEGNAADFQNSAPRADWGNPTFGGQTISVSSGAVILLRQNDNDNMLPLDGMAGVEVDAILHLQTINLEFSWLGVFSVDGTQYLPAIAGDYLPTLPPVAWYANGLLSTQYSSDLNSFEFNARLPTSKNFTTILGLRYINLHEAVQLQVSSPVQDFGWKTITSNNLFGAQAGGDLVISRLGSFQMNAIGKAGIYVNSIKQEGMIVGFPIPGAVLVDDGSSQVAFLGELKLTGTYRFTDYLAVNAGYQAMWLSNVAFGQNQFSAISFANGGGIDATGSPLLHGATIQAVVSW
ncbi:MAG: hypothetical protein ACKVP0_03885 [Pirellulaceae bacterium]